MFKVACVVWCAFHSVSTINIIHFERGFKSNRVHLTRLLPKLPELLLILCPILSSLFKFISDWPGPTSNFTLRDSIPIPGFVFQFELDWLGPLYMFIEGSHSMIEFYFFFSLREHSLGEGFSKFEHCSYANSLPHIRQRRWLPGVRLIGSMQRSACVRDRILNFY